MWTWILKTLLSLFLEDIFFKKYLKPLISLLSGNFGIFTLKVLFITKPIRICCCSVTKLCLTLCDPMDGSTPGLPVPHHLPEFTYIHVYWVGNAIQQSLPLLPSSAFNLSWHPHHLFQWISSFHQVAKVLELQLQHQSFQWVFRVDFL